MEEDVWEGTTGRTAAGLLPVGGILLGHDDVGERGALLSRLSAAMRPPAWAAAPRPPLGR